MVKGPGQTNLDDGTALQYAFAILLSDMLEDTISLYNKFELVVSWGYYKS